jgi:hypothetical protein
VGFIASVSVDIPWHVTAFHRDYKMVAPANTSVKDLVGAAEIGQAAGLRFVYAGNIPGRVKGLENTRCPACGGLFDLAEPLPFAPDRFRILSVRAKNSNLCRSAVNNIDVSFLIASKSLILENRYSRFS